MLVADVVLCEDGHAQERSMTAAILEMVQPGDLWIKDRNFCTTAFLFGIARRGGSFVTRQHGSTLSWQTVGERVSQGRCETGAVFEQTVRLSNDDGELLFVRRITVELDQPTRDGDRTIHILTNLPATAADAVKVAELYRRRWTLETAFQELEASLHGEINPKFQKGEVGISIVVNGLRRFLIPVSGYTVINRSASACNTSASVTWENDVRLGSPATTHVLRHRVPR